MQRFYITDGKNYIRRAKGKYLCVSSPSVATEFSLADGKKVLTNSLGKRYQGYYLEGIDDFKKITQDEVVQCPKRTDNEEVAPEVLDDLEEAVKTFSEVNFPSGEKLTGLKTNLETAISYYDQQKSDLYHWIATHNPPAHTMAKVYKIQQNIVQKRARAKENYGFVLALSDAEKQRMSITETKKLLAEKTYSPYTPKTMIWDELDGLLRG